MKRLRATLLITNFCCNSSRDWTISCRSLPRSMASCPTLRWKWTHWLWPSKSLKGCLSSRGGSISSELARKEPSLLWAMSLTSFGAANFSTSWSWPPFPASTITLPTRETGEVSKSRFHSHRKKMTAFLCALSSKLRCQKMSFSGPNLNSLPSSLTQSWSKKNHRTNENLPQTLENACIAISKTRSLRLRRSQNSSNE